MSGITDIKHVVILTQENRSFDEYFGTFPGAIGFGDPNGVFTQLYCPAEGGADSPTNDIKPFRMSTFTSSGLRRYNSPHGWANMQGAYSALKNGTPYYWNQGAGTEAIIGYYAANDIAFHWSLASAFVLCDNYFASALSATAPNRLSLLSGCIQDPRNLEPGGFSAPPGQFPGPAINISSNDDPDGPGDPYPSTGQSVSWSSYAAYLSTAPGTTYSQGTLSWSSYADLLSQAGVDWRVYDETFLAPDSNENDPSQRNGWGSMNLLQQFASWPGVASSEHAQPNILTGTVDGVNQNGWPANPVKASGQFEADAAAGTLPPVSWLVPPFWASEWENNFAPDGGAYIAGKLKAILNGIHIDPATHAQSPLWDCTLFIVVYDESGGHFDHVLPPVPPQPSADIRPAAIRSVPVSACLRS
jgi:phospholipase C